MNKTYRSVWNESTGTWVAAQENARGKARSKKSPPDAGAVVAAGKVALVAVVAPLCVGFGAFTPDFAMASGICVMNTGGSKALDSQGGVQSGSNFAAGCPAIASQTTWLDGTKPNTANALQLYADSTQIDLNNANKSIFFSPDGASKLWMRASGSNVLLNGVASGSVTAASLDGVNGSQLFNAAQTTANAIGGGSAVDPTTGKITNPTFNLGGKTYNNVAGALTSIDARVNNLSTVGGIKYFHANSTQTDSLASGSESIAVGVAAVSSGAASIAEGAMASASGDSSVALGAGASATGSKSVALGAGSVANSSTLGLAGFNAGNTALSAGTASGELSIGGVGAERRITNVAAGYSATDAVNVSQLMSANAKVNQMGANTAAAMGGNSSFNSTTGAITNPTYIVAKGTYNSVGAALTALDNSKGADNPLAVAYDDTSKNQITLQGTSGATKISKLAAGTASGDAVNVSQLSGVTAALGGGASVTADGAINAPTYKVYGNTFSNVGDALANISDSTGNLVQNVKYIRFGDSTAAQAQASGDNSIALGGDAFANADNSVAIGSAARAMAANSVALGVGSTTNAANTVSVGSVTAQRRIVNVADGTGDSDAATVGQMKQSDAALQAQISALASPKLLKSSTLLGATSDTDPATVAQLKGVANALGGGATVATDGSVTAPGYVVHGATYANVGDAVANIAKVTDKVAFGPTSSNYAMAAGTDSIAVGGNSFATSDGAIAMGVGARAMAPGSVAIGYGSAATVANTFAVGSSTAGRRIVNVADGINDTDAATVGQVTSDIQAAISNLQASTVQNPTLLKSAMLQSPQLLGQTSSLTPDQMLMAGPTQKGGGIQATGTDSVAIGLSAKATADSALAIGSVVTVTDNMGVGIGQNIAAKGTNTVVIGSNTSALGSGVIAIGNNYTAVDGDGAVGIGNNVNVGALNSVAIGTNTVASGTNSVTLGYASTDGGRANVISVGNTKTGGQRQIINVAAGTQKTDAVNVSQLTGVTAALGGGATVNTDGSIKPPTYNVQNTAATDVGTAIAKLDGAVTGLGNNLTTLNTTVNNILNGGGIKYFHANSALGDSSASGAESVAIGGGAVATTANSVALGSNSVASSGTLGASGFAPGGATLTAATAFGEVSVGASGKERRITNVAAGYAATDAVNVSQLMAEDQKVNNVSANVSNLSDTVNNIKKGGGSLTYFHANSSLTDSTASGVNSISVGPQATAAGTNAIAVGYNASATAADSVALGSNATTTANLSATAYNPGNSTLSGTTASGEVSVGNGSFNRRITNVAAGSTVTTIGGAITNLDARVYANSTDITNLQTQINEGGIGLVTQNQSSRNITVASQTDGSIVDFTGKDGARVLTGVAAGTGDLDAVNNAQLKAAGIISGDGSMKTAVTYDTTTDNTGKTVTNYSSITLGDGSSGAAPVAIHNVAAGEKDTDAVNYSQYADLLSKVNSISNAGTGVDTLFVGDGDRNTEQAKAGGTHATAMGALSVANGLQSVATGYASNASGSNAVAIGANSTASGNNSVALGAGSVASEDNTVSVGSASQQRRVTNVAAGTATTDAVNVGQLNDAITNASNNTVNQAVQQSNSYTDSQFNKMNDKMNSLGAAAMAATSLIPNARAEGNFQMSAAAGTYGGAAAVAVGANYWVNDRFLVNAHVTRATGNGASTGASAGVTIGF
ncbi:YadA-like family protein [Paraburkholderia caribensis]|uniref:YadA-like family protein n=1 Tax=Paraburkholderia caribensis TaxID=75105 RepID=UPI00158FB7B5|nr:YadA-like family protein [Paraburkholderia caribensis]